MCIVPAWSHRFPSAPECFINTSQTHSIVAKYAFDKSKRQRLITIIIWIIPQAEKQYYPLATSRVDLFSVKTLSTRNIYCFVNVQWILCVGVMLTEIDFIMWVLVSVVRFCQLSRSFYVSLFNSEEFKVFYLMKK